MDRLITDKPRSDEEATLNYAYAKGGSVYLRYGGGEEDIGLCEYLSRIVSKNKPCGRTSCEISSGECAGRDCEIAILYAVAMQAAGLRARLIEYKDAEEQGLLLWLPCKPGDTVYEIVHPGCRDCAVIDHERYKSCHVQYGDFCGKEEVRAIPFSPGCLDYMGGLVFLTREEAERAIKEGASNV